MQKKFGHAVSLFLEFSKKKKKNYVMQNKDFLAINILNVKIHSTCKRFFPHLHVGLRIVTYSKINQVIR